MLITADEVYNEVEIDLEDDGTITISRNPPFKGPDIITMTRAQAVALHAALSKLLKL